MSFLRTASFGGLFLTTFVVAATCQVAFSLLSVLIAVMAPGAFNMNGEAATNPVQALGVLLFLLIFGLFMNAAISAIGAGLWLGVRRLLPRQAD